MIDQDPGSIPNLPELNGTLYRICAPITEVSASFRLVPDEQTLHEAEVDEFQSLKLDSHIIMLHADGNIANDHARLQERTTAVFPEIHIGNNLLLIVPEGTRSLRSIVPLLPRDIDNYSDIFDQLGQTLRSLNEAGLGMPDKGKLLHKFAFAPDEQSPSGGRIFLVPPYNLGDLYTVDDILNQLHEELTMTADLSKEQLTQVLGKVQNGWAKIG